MVDSDSDKEEAYQSPRQSSPAPSSPRHGRSPTEETGSDSEVEATSTADADSRFLPQRPRAASPILKPRVRKPSAKAAAYPLPIKKKRRVISEPESEDEYAGDGDSGNGPVPMEEDDFEVPLRRFAKTKGRTKSSGKESKLDRHRGGSTESAPVTGTKRPRPKPSSRLEDTTVDIVGDFEPDAAAPSPQSLPQNQDALTSPPPKKRTKLPTIKKNKNVNSVGPSTPSTTSLPPKPTPAKPPTVEAGQPPVAGVRKTPATVGNADFDLRNANVYRELFKTVCNTCLPDLWILPERPAP